MAEAVRRFQSAGSPDLVRRLMARPVRLAHQARTRLPEREAALAPSDAGPEHGPTEHGLPQHGLPQHGLPGPDLDRLETELEVLKAILRAQRKEVESLRAQRQLLTESSPDDDVRATRERWAALVDSLMIQAR